MVLPFNPNTQEVETGGSDQVSLVYIEHFRRARIHSETLSHLTHKRALYIIG